MYLAFYDENNIFITPEVGDAYRPDQNTVNQILHPAFNNAMPEEQYQLFSSGRSALLPAVHSQFEAYLSFCLNKVNNWEKLRDAYNHQRLAVISYEDDEASPIWYCIPTTTEQTIETYTPPAQTVEVAAQPTVTEQLNNMTLSQAIEFVKQKAQSFAEAKDYKDRLQAYKEELEALDIRRAEIVQTIASLEQYDYPTQEEFDAIAELAGTLKQLM